jgi:hypothetical protein
MNLVMMSEFAKSMKKTPTVSAGVRPWRRLRLE